MLRLLRRIVATGVALSGLAVAVTGVSIVISGPAPIAEFSVADVAAAIERADREKHIYVAITGGELVTERGGVAQFVDEHLGVPMIPRSEGLLPVSVCAWR